jgi:hypothetical protein
MRRTFILLLVLLAAPAWAQTKPVGTFQLSSCDASPGWSSFALLIDTQDFAEAADCSRRTGLRWVLGFYSRSPYEPIAAYARATRARADAAGLTPFLWAMVYSEEWYEYALTPGALWIPGLDPANPAHHAPIVETVAWWTGHQHAALREAFPAVPVAWITGLVNRSRAYGDALWRPLPPGVSVIALEAYVPTGHAWDSTAGLFIRHAAATETAPIVLIAQAFVAPGDPLWGTGPTEAIVDGLAAALRDPRVWGTWLFTMESRANGLIGLADLPYWHARYAQALGVQ